MQSKKPATKPLIVSGADGSTSASAVASTITLSSLTFPQLKKNSSSAPSSSFTVAPPGIPTENLPQANGQQHCAGCRKPAGCVVLEPS